MNTPQSDQSLIRLCRFGLALVIPLLLAACATPTSLRGGVASEIDKAMDEARQQTGEKKVPADISSALLPPLEISLPKGKKSPISARFDLTVNNGSARQVFLSLVEGTKYSVVVSPSVSGRVSLNLKNITVPEAFDALRRVYGYGYHRSADRFYVKGRGIQTRLFPVNYLNINRKGQSGTRVSAGELTRSSGASGQGAAGTQFRAGIEVSTESEQNFWKELDLTLRTLIGEKRGRMVVINPQAGLVVVRAMPSELQVVEDFLGITHKTINRQVVLEAKILEVELSSRFQAGINWSGLANVAGSTVTASQIGGGSIFGSDGISSIAGNTGVLNPAAPTALAGSNISAFGGVFTLAIQGGNFTAFLEALKSQGDVQVLSSPRVSTVNNQKAVIKVGGDEFFITETQTTPSTVAGGVPIVTAKLTPFFSGIALDVTPQIDSDGNIILHIHPSVSTVTQKTISVDVGGVGKLTLPTAASTIQETDNIVRARSGQVIVIGGLMKEGLTDQKASIPFLAGIPIVGNLFKHKKVVRVKKELVILLKPTLMNLGEDWAEMADSSKLRIDNIRKGFRN